MADLEGQKSLSPEGDEVASRALAKLDERQNAMLQAVFGQIAAKEFHNFVGTDQERWRLLSLATGPACKGFDDLKDQAIAMRFFYVHRIQLEAISGGEVIEATRSVLITKDLQAFAFVSDGVARDLARIINLFGVGPYEPPKKIKVESVKTRHGFRAYTLVPA